MKREESGSTTRTWSVWRCVADEMWCGAFIRVSTVLRRYEKLRCGGRRLRFGENLLGVDYADANRRAEARYHRQSGPR